LRTARNQVEQSLDARHLGKAGSLRCPDAGILGLWRALVNPMWMTRVVDKIVAFFSLHPPQTRLETAPSNGAVGSWSAPETAA